MSQTPNRYFTGMPCKRGHIAERYISTRQCSECQNENKRIWRNKAENKQKEIVYRNSEVSKTAAKISRLKRYSLNPEKYILRSRKWKALNKEHVLNYAKQYKKLNRGYYTFLQNLRKKNIRQATPKWCNLKELKMIYIKANDSRKLGHDVEVDHIIPIKNKYVCGLNVPWNLQIIPAVENRKKHNVFKEQ